MKKSLGILWFFVHFGVEVISFQFFLYCFRNTALAVIMAFIFDILAFFPQLYIAFFAERFQKVPIGLIGAGMVLLGAAAGFLGNVPLRIAGLVILTLGNAIVHVGGAEATLYRCDRKITPTSLFVAGGAIGVGLGTYLGTKESALLIGWGIMLVCSLLIPLSEKIKGERHQPRIRMARTGRPKWMVVFFSFFVVALRGLLSYAIPMGWKSTVEQTLLVFACICLGKALGGILSDTLGARKTAIGSTVLALPFLLIGGNNMWCSLMGIVLFSMTMATTLGILVTVFPQTPLIAYGITTMGLLTGILPVFSPTVLGFISNSVVLSVLNLICVVMLWLIMSPDPSRKVLRTSS